MTKLKMKHLNAKIARQAVLGMAAGVDFDTMGKKAYGEWLDGLSIDEFIELMEMVDEHQKTGQMFAVVVPDPDAWIEYPNRNGESPLPNGALCWVRFVDGGVAGPNRADHFLWSEVAESTRVSAYQVVPAA